MRRPEPGEYDDYYQVYIDRTQGTDLLQNLTHSANAFSNILQSCPPEKYNYAYAEGKWTVLQLLRHVIDADMVFTNRALWLVRNEGGDLPGFEEDLWAANSLKGRLEYKSLMQQFFDLRSFTKSLFESFSPAMLETQGRMNGSTTKVISIPFIISGHTLHHTQILKERYL